MGADRHRRWALPALVTAASLAVVLGLFAHAVPPRSFEPALLSPPPPLPESPSLLVRPGASSGRVVLATAPTEARFADARVGVRVATYLQPASATLRLEARAADGRVVAACTVPPEAYGDLSIVTCPAEDTADLRTLTVEAAGGRGPLAVYAALDAGTLEGGGVYSDPPSRALSDQIEAAVDRLAVTRPTLLGPFVVGVALTAGLALLGLALAALRRVPPSSFRAPDA